VLGQPRELPRLRDEVIEMRDDARHLLKPIQRR
jgi:hypothetical protein